MVDNRQRVVLASVTRKVDPDIADFIRQLQMLGDWHVIGSAGTCKHLAKAGIEAQDIADMITQCVVHEFVAAGIGFKTEDGRDLSAEEVATLLNADPMLGHRVVSISRQKSASLLAKAVDADLAELAKYGIPFIDMVVCDFYALKRAIEAEGATIESVLEATDIGGPTMVSEGAKGRRIVICDPADRQMVIDEMSIRGGDISEETRNALCAKADGVVAQYRLESARFHSGGAIDGFVAWQVIQLAYGPNPHQQPASLFLTGGDYVLAPSRFISAEGMKASCNNCDDLHTLRETATRLAAVFPAQEHSFALAAKHVNVCGAGIVKGKSDEAIIEAIRSMIEGDEVAIHGGVLLLNFHVTVAIADMLLHYHMAEGQRRILDAIFAPSADPEAIEMLARKKGKCRIMLNPALAGELPMDPTWPFVHVGGGEYTHYPPSQFVLSFDDPDLKIVGTRRPELEGCLKAGWAIGSQAKSNTITIVRQRQAGDMLVYELEGNGCGRMDRVGAAELAVRIYQRGEETKPQEQRVGLQSAVAYSDSFMPFSDAGQVLHQAGVTVVFASSGSVNDQTVQDNLAALGMTLYLIPDKKCRGFRH